MGCALERSSQNINACFFNSKKCGKHDNMVNNNKHIPFLVKKNFEKLHGPYQSCKKQLSDRIYLNYIKFIIYN